MRSIVQTFAAESYPSAAAGTTIGITTRLKDESDNLLSASDLTTLALTIVDTKDGAVMGDIEDVDILNAGRGTVSDDGEVKITFEPDDTVLAADVARAVLGAVLTWTYGSGKKGEVQVNFKVQRLPGVA